MFQKEFSNLSSVLTSDMGVFPTSPVPPASSFRLAAAARPEGGATAAASSAPPAIDVAKPNLIPRRILRSPPSCRTGGYGEGTHGQRDRQASWLTAAGAGRASSPRADAQGSTSTSVSGSMPASAAAWSSLSP